MNFVSRASHVCCETNLFYLRYREPCRVLNDRFCLYVEMSLILTLNFLEKVSSDEKYFCLDLLVRCKLCFAT